MPVLMGRPDLRRLWKTCPICGKRFEGTVEQTYDRKECKWKAAYVRRRRRAS